MKREGPDFDAKVQSGFWGWKLTILWYDLKDVTLVTVLNPFGSAVPLAMFNAFTLAPLQLIQHQPFQFNGM